MTLDSLIVAGIVGAKSSTGEEQWEEVAWVDKGVQNFPWTLPAMQVSMLIFCLSK